MKVAFIDRQRPMTVPEGRTCVNDAFEGNAIESFVFSFVTSDGKMGYVYAGCNHHSAVGIMEAAKLNIVGLWMGCPAEGH